MAKPDRESINRERAFRMAIRMLEERVSNDYYLSHLGRYGEILLIIRGVVIPLLRANARAERAARIKG